MKYKELTPKQEMGCRIFLFLWLCGFAFTPLIVTGILTYIGFSIVLSLGIAMIVWMLYLVTLPLKWYYNIAIAKFGGKMKYTKEDFSGDLPFFLGFLRGAIREHNRTVENKINFERFEQFEKYCFDRFSTKKGVIKR